MVHHLHHFPKGYSHHRIATLSIQPLHLPSFPVNVILEWTILAGTTVQWNFLHGQQNARWLVADHGDRVERSSRQ